MKTQSKQSQQSLTPAKSLELLKAGNERFCANLRANRSLLEQVYATADGQYPFAIVLSCIDSRTPAELVFDQGLGDIFSVRVAGNVLNDDILASMEYACAVAGSKLVVVLGHSSCGAVKGACDGVQLGHLSGLLEKLQGAVASAKQRGPAEGEQLIQHAAEDNVQQVVEQIQQRSSVLRDLITQGKVGVVGGMYSVQSGQAQLGPLVCGGTP